MSSMELAGGLGPATAAAIIAAALMAGAACGAAFAGRGRGWRVRTAVGSLYGLAAGALAVVVLGPVGVLSSQEPIRPRIVLLADRSASMTERDLPGDRARWDAVTGLLAADSQFRSGLERLASVQVLGFDLGVRPLSAAEAAGPPEGRATDLAGSIAATLETPGVGDLAAVVVVSDGRATAGLPAAVAAPSLAARRVPIWTIGTGEPVATARPRLRILGLEVPETAMLGQEVAATASVEAGNLTGRRIELRLLVDGAELARQELPASAPSERLPVRFAFQAKPEGVRRVELRAAAGESCSARAMRHMVVLSSPVRVYYAEGRLGWGHREMATALASVGGDRSLELWNGFLPPESRPAAADAGVASRTGKFDVMVLGDVSAAELGENGPAALARAIREDGCGLLFMADPERAATFRGTPLEALLPAALPFETLSAGTAAAAAKVEVAGDPAAVEPLRLSDSPAENHRLWSSLAETRPGWKLGATRNGAEVRLRAGGEPVLVSWKAGAGRVAVMNWPDHWRWARSSPEGADAHRRFFGRLAAWLAGRAAARGERLALTLGSYRLAPGEETSLVARLLQAPPAGPVEATALIRATGARDADGGETLRIAPAAPGIHRAALRAGAPGEYRAEVVVRAGGADWAKGEMFFSVEGRDAETENPAPDFAALEAIARATGGRSLPLAEAGKLPEMLGKVLPRPEPRLRSLRTTLWDRAWLLWLATASLCGAWVILRRGR